MIERYRKTPYIPAKDPLSAIPPSRHPFQFWAMLACAVTGAGNLVDSQSPVNDLLPPFSVALWALMMLLGGSMAMVGAFAKDRLLGLLMERFALGAIALAAGVYGVAILYVAQREALTAGALTTGISIASLWRLVHLRRELKILKTMIGWINK